MYFTFVRNAQVRLNQEVDEARLKRVYADVLEHVERNDAPAQLILNFQQALMVQFGGTNRIELMNILKPRNDQANSEDSEISMT